MLFIVLSPGVDDERGSDSLGQHLSSSRKGLLMMTKSTLS